MRIFDSSRLAIAMAIALTACGNPDDGPSAATDDNEDGSTGAASEDPSGQPSTDPSGNPATASTTSAASSSADDAASDDGESGSESAGESDPDSSGGVDDTGAPGDAIHSDAFDGPDGSPWPDPWVVVGDGVISSELDTGRGRLSSATMHTGRIALDGFAELDTEVWATVTFDDPTAQGFGFYVRQNGGALQDTDPPGLGYAVYLEGAYLRAIGIWRETNGVEEPLLETPDPVPGGLQAGVPYRVRFQCEQNGTTTSLRAKVWPSDAAEPEAWSVSVEDDTPELQQLAGSFAIDNYNYTGTASIYLDDVVISRM
jgi:hypothetical protein